MKKKIWLSSPHMGGTEMKYVQEAYDTNWVAPLGKNVDEFELSLAKYTGVKHVAALSSGTAAIHLALLLLGVKSGDYVIASSFTFSATVNPIKMIGANPVLIDSEELTWNINPELLEKAIIELNKKTKKPKVIILVHLYGMPAQLDTLMKIADKYDIPIIEDAAEALGSAFENRKLGTFGKLSILSFNGNKIITTSGGGALLSGHKELIDKARFLATQARDNAPHYQHSEIGYNYRMSNILAGIGRGQLEVLDDRVNRRREINEFYKNELSKIKVISFLVEPDNRFYSNFWLTTILIDPLKTNGKTSEQLRLLLEKENIESRPLWKPMHLQPVFNNCLSFINGVSENLFNNGLCLPSGSNMSENDLNYVVEIIKDFFK